MKPTTDKAREWLLKWGKTDRVWPAALVGFLIGLTWAYLTLHLILDHIR